MGESKAVEVENFSHVCVGVSDMDVALAFYTGILGMDVVFDVNLDGEGLESVTGGSGAHGRMSVAWSAARWSNCSISVRFPRTPRGRTWDTPTSPFGCATSTTPTSDSAPTQTEYGPPTSIAGVRMLFLYDPDGTPIEFIELPGGATSTVEMWRPATG